MRRLWNGITGYSALVLFMYSKAIKAVKSWAK